MEEIKGHQRNSQSTGSVGLLNVWKGSENIGSWIGAMGKRELDVHESPRVTDLMLWCGPDETRKAEGARREYDIRAELLDMSLSILQD